MTSSFLFISAQRKARWIVLDQFGSHIYWVPDIRGIYGDLDALVGDCCILCQDGNASLLPTRWHRDSAKNHGTTGFRHFRRRKPTENKIVDGIVEDHVIFGANILLQSLSKSIGWFCWILLALQMGSEEPGITGTNRIRDLWVFHTFTGDGIIMEFPRWWLYSSTDASNIVQHSPSQEPVDPAFTPQKHCHTDTKCCCGIAPQLRPVPTGHYP